MGRYVEINKQSQTFNIHYYKVISHDHPEVKLFYIGLNETTQKVFFYEDIEREPVAIVDLDGSLQYQSEKIKDRIPRWLIFLCLKKAKDAFLANKFSSNMSFQS